MRHAERSPPTPLDYPLIEMARKKGGEMGCSVVRLWGGTSCATQSGPPPRPLRKSMGGDLRNGDGPPCPTLDGQVVALSFKNEF